MNSKECTIGGTPVGGYTANPSRFKENGGIVGYKSCGNSIVVLRLLPNSKNNLARSNVFAMSTAKYRCDMAYVANIYDKITNTKRKKVYSDYNSKFVYKTGKMVQVHDYEENIQVVCAPGIHFYLSEECAFFYNLYKYMNIIYYSGIYKSWYGDGTLFEEYEYLSNLKNGKYTRWHENGNLDVCLNYDRGVVSTFPFLHPFSH